MDSTREGAQQVTSGPLLLSIVAVKEFYTLLEVHFWAGVKKIQITLMCLSVCENPLSRVELLLNFTLEYCILPSLWNHVTKSLQRIESGTLSPA